MNITVAGVGYVGLAQAATRRPHHPTHTALTTPADDPTV